MLNLSKGEIMDEKEILFSIIMPTYNRAFCIEGAIDSLLKQTYQGYELIIIDDGSTDNTEKVIKEKYGNLLGEKLKYICLDTNKGVCYARNTGLENAKNEWIAYLDTDNTLRPYFLQEFYEAILQNPTSKNFYAQIINSDNLIIGKDFNHKSLYEANYIDMGVYVHHKSLYEKYGGFDTKLKRLVDWDLILRYTKKETPVYIKKILLDYSSSKDYERISLKESHDKARRQVRKKHYRLERFLKSIFSITDQYINLKWYKVITIFGIKIKIRNKAKNTELT